MAPSYRYEEQVKESINEFMKQTVKYDYLDGNREINLNLTVGEAELLYHANDHIKDMVESGEL